MALQVIGLDTVKLCGPHRISRVRGVTLPLHSGHSLTTSINRVPTSLISPHLISPNWVHCGWSQPWQTGSCTVKRPI